MSIFSSIAKAAGVVAAPFTGGASLLPSLVSGGLSLAGSMMQNNSAKQIAKSNNDTSIELANTAHQREVEDLRAAGLNPILSAHGAGASVPSMQSAPVSNVLEGAVSSASRNATLKAQLDNIAADTAQKLEAAELTRRQQKVADAQLPLISEQTQNAVADYWLKSSQVDLNRANVTNATNAGRISSIDAEAHE